MPTDLLQILAAVCRDNVGRHAAGRLVSMSALEWRDFLALARVHGVLALAAARLLADETLAPERRSELRSVWDVLRMRVVRETGAALQVLDAVEGRGFEILPLKGPFLSQQLYGTIGLRQSRDLDFLVRLSDAWPIVTILEQLGYAPTNPALLASRRGREFLARIDSHVVLRRGRQVVELHWRLSEDVPDADGLFSCLDRRPFAGRPILMMPPELLLIYLSAHGHKHLWQKLQWIVDIAMLLGVVDWDLVQRRSADGEAGFTVGVGVLLAHALTGADGPPDVLSRYRSHRRAAAVAFALERRLRMGAPRAVRPAELLRARLQIEPRLRDKVASAWSALTAPSVRDWNLLPLPPLLFPVHRAVAAARHLVKAGGIGR